jgi:hypothetical protein
MINNVADPGTPWSRKNMPETTRGGGQEIRALEGHHFSAWTGEIKRVSGLS